MEMPQIHIAPPSPEEEMDRLVHSFIEAKGFLARHFLMRRISRLPNRESIEIHGSPLLIAKWHLAVFKFAFQHGRRTPNCSCMDD